VSDQTHMTLLASSQRGLVPLHLASESTSVTSLLLNAGAEIDAKDEVSEFNPRFN
jgi:hypothetical protein